MRRSVLWATAMVVAGYCVLQPAFLAQPETTRKHDEWLERVGEYQVVIPRLINGQGIPVPSTGKHFPSKRSGPAGEGQGIPATSTTGRRNRAKRSVFQHPGINMANKPYYRSEEEYPGDPLYPSDGSIQESYHSNNNNDIDPNPGQHPGVHPGQHPGLQNGGHGVEPNSYGYNLDHHGNSVGNERVENKIHPIDSGEVKHSYEVHNSREFDSTMEQFDNHVMPNHVEPRSEHPNESSDKSRDSPPTNQKPGKQKSEFEPEVGDHPETDIDPVAEADGSDESWDNAHYSLEAFGRQFDLHLEPNLDFVSGGVVIQHLDTNRTWLSDDTAVGLHCFHRGKVAGDPTSSVVLSICDHLFGEIRAYDENYFIEPHPEVLGGAAGNTSGGPRTPSGGRQVPHIIYKHRLNLTHPHGNNNNNHGNNDNNNNNKDDEKSSCATNGGPYGYVSDGATEEKQEYFKHERRKQNGVYPSNGNHGSNSVNNNNRHLHGNAHSRHKRSTSWERNVEVLVVADYLMARYHGNDLQRYVLTLMSIVHNIYKDPSIGNAINIVVVKVLVLESERAGPSISANAAATLKEFCKFQRRQNNDDDTSPHHHDTAVLITRQDICRSAAKCDTLGLAELGTMCDLHRSCSINEDNGLSAAFTIAHELGHVFNLPHDDDYKCRQFPEQMNGPYHVMAPTLDYNTHPWTWSRCSTMMLTEFLDGGHGDCLLDKPVSLSYDRKMFKDHGAPGEAFDSSRQCSVVFGSGSKICPYMPTCKRLWCTSPRGLGHGCRTQHMPWADGTACGRDKWCHQGECVYRRKRKSRDGEWGIWQHYGDCSRTCGGGVKHATRHCNEPEPSHGGRYCVGKRIRYKSCNTHECVHPKMSFRQEQCADFNGHHRNINGLPPGVTWEPKYDGIHVNDRCKLFCKVKTSNAYYLLKDKAKDGTKCGPDTSDICVNGQCRKAGCDNHLGSSTKTDKCGVCGGDSSSCQTVSGTFNQVRYGYNRVVRIPAGATNIDIRQHGFHNQKEDNNYLALRMLTNDFILNGDFIVSVYRKLIEVSGIKMEYSGSDHVVERINCSRMLTEDIELLVLAVGDLHPPDIRYSYTISRLNVKSDFGWSKEIGPWSECNRACQGEQRRRVLCVRKKDSRIVSDVRCEATGHDKPPGNTQKCNLHCSIRWQILDQTECSSRCGDGYIIRRIKCVKRTQTGNEYMDDKHCMEVGPKPDVRIACHGMCLATHWAYTEWSECSASCGTGRQYREAKCVDMNGAIMNDADCDAAAQVLEQSCNNDPCPVWVAGSWTGCSVSCGDGLRHRQVYCKRGDEVISADLCEQGQQPETKEQCDLDPCPTWFTGYWSGCSASCGKGVKKRAVRCLAVSGGILNDAECNAATRPHEEATCYLPACETTPIYTTAQTSVAPPGHHAPHGHAPSGSSGNDAGGSDPAASSPGGGGEHAPSPPPVNTGSTPDQSATQWRTGSWTACSMTCGEGRRERYVSCRNHEGNIADDAYCVHLPRPSAAQACRDKPCGHWRTGAWTSCSQTCGAGGIQTRYVACMVLDDLDEQMARVSECDVSVKPSSERGCNGEPCTPVEEQDIHSISSNRVTGTSHWRAGPWGGCSSTCEGGWRQRAVVCQDEKGMSHDCDPEGKPADREPCNSGPCPLWNYGSWGECSQNCDGGIQERMVICQLPSGQTLPDQNCDVMERPINSQRCGLEPCVTSVSAVTNQNSPHAHWFKGPWSPCTVTCGRGHKTREVTCVDHHGDVIPDVECGDNKPKSFRKCRKGRCPRWVTKAWSKCSVTCGEGVKRREVKCIRNKHRSVSAAECSNATRPLLVEACSLQECTRYQWVTGSWSKCSQSCGSGKKLRKVTCVDTVSGQPIRDELCENETKPRDSRRCSKLPCPYMWITGDWTQCSVTCGSGEQQRSVTCQEITREGWILPEEKGSGPRCDASTRPTARQACSLGPCSAEYHWKTDAWSECSKPCGQGRAKRKVYCADRFNQQQPRRFCAEGDRPPTTRWCYSQPCYASSCRELRRIASTSKDGTYSLLVQGKLLQVFCSGMKHSKPAEYLTVPSGYRENYSEVYPKRLLDPETCPHNGTRSATCPCHKQAYTRAGYTSFSKIRLNITSLTVINDDFKFSTTKGAKRIPFASAGDCYSAGHCPQGSFRVDLQGTGLTVAPTSEWYKFGHKATSWIHILQNDQIVEGRCGGYCGHCAPHSATGLRLEVGRGS